VETSTEGSTEGFREQVERVASLYTCALSC